MVCHTKYKGAKKIIFLKISELVFWGNFLTQNKKRAALDPGIQGARKRQRSKAGFISEREEEGDRKCR